MRILELRFKNLNSLQGEWCIDFTDPAYTSAGIFALTGPTGAGKSTVLDALCLALYGATPRLSRITKGGNEIMTRQTGECFAEVLFESQAGRYRCHFYQHRARKKADGNLADARHEISDGLTGKPIETMKSRVLDVIEEKTGMDFDRFTRSMLLAQGAFDTFLKADVEHKSRILEQITGTDIYTRISCRVHERLREEKEALARLQAETAGIVMLSPEDEDALGREVDSERARETALAARLADIDGALAWLTRIETLKRELGELNAEAEALDAETAAFRPERERLVRAEGAAVLDGLYATLTAHRKQQDADGAELESLRRSLPDLEASVKRHLSALTRSGDEIRTARDAVKTMSPVIQSVRALDQRLADRIRMVNQADAECRADEARIDREQALVRQETDRRRKTEKELTERDGYLDEHGDDAWLAYGLAGIEEQLGRLRDMRQEISEAVVRRDAARAACDVALKRKDACVADRQARRGEVLDIGRRLVDRKNELAALLDGRLLREYRTEKDTLMREMAFLRTIADLASERDRLSDGSPCPLCGSTDHPFARGNVPPQNETETAIARLTRLIGQAEDLEGVVASLAAEEQAAGKRLSDSEKRQADAGHAVAVAETALADLDRMIDDLGKREAHLTGVIRQNLASRNVTPDTMDPDALQSDLRARLTRWRDHLARREALEKQLVALDRDLEKRAAVLETLSAALADKRDRLVRLRSEVDGLRHERTQMFGERDPDAEALRLDQALTRAERLDERERAAHDEERMRLDSVRVSMKALDERIGTRRGELDALDTEFQTALRRAGFSDETAFTAARLSQTEKDALRVHARRLDERRTALSARRTDREQRLATENARCLTPLTLDQLNPLRVEVDNELKQVREVLVGLRHRLSENASARERIREKQAAVEARREECGRFERLHGLIGSADGKKFRNFAQGLTFERLVAQANRRLEKMTDRYLLIRDEDQPLSLNVIDNYQAGDIRSTRNLSGGESFIVSLALALGLSAMAGRNIRVDSLFLDEGFGSLDEDTLETALDALSALHGDGKLIGVISHVPALNERIPVRITVTPVSGGKSVLSGPGCTGA
ncbi:AAA family ATPase [Desulfatiferula olefinivorans]